MPQNNDFMNAYEGNAVSVGLWFLALLVQVIPHVIASVLATVLIVVAVVLSVQGLVIGLQMVLFSDDQFSGIGFTVEALFMLILESVLLALVWL